MTIDTAANIFPAGWPLRLLSLGELKNIIEKHKPSLVEVSKDQVNSVSIKQLKKILLTAQKTSGFSLSFAGTTNFSSCSGFEWSRYLCYLDIQVAQARFLGCEFFRVILGDDLSPGRIGLTALRLEEFCRRTKPIIVCVETHGASECDPQTLRKLLDKCPVDVVIDFANIYDAGYSMEDFLSYVPMRRIAYSHQRNLPFDIWTEHAKSSIAEIEWSRVSKNKPRFWEPKELIDAKTIKELYDGYRSAN